MSNYEIARKFGLSETAVSYHLDLKYRKWVKHYRTEYMTARYHSDPEFRQRILGHVKKYQQKVIARNKRIPIAVGAVLNCPYSQATWRAPYKYMPHLCPECHHWFIRKLPLQLSEDKKISVQENE
jgi:hypothetical protein